MTTDELRQQFKDIAESEYYKICEQYPVIAGEESSYSIEAFSILNTELLGVSYWHNSHGSSFVYCELVYYVHSQDRSKGGVCFRTIEEAEEYLKKTKAKQFKNPFDCCITKEYIPNAFIDSVSDETFKLLEKDIQLKKTVIYKK